MSRIHETISGRKIAFPDQDEVTDAFIRLVKAMVEIPDVTEETMIALIYGKKNPILERGGMLEWGRVSRRVLGDPRYLVLMDLLARKRVAEDHLGMEVVSAPFTMTVTEASESVGVTPGAIRVAIQSRKLPAWVRGGEYRVDPLTLGVMKESPHRGRAKIRPLKAVLGPELRLKVDGRGELEGEVEVDRWFRAAVLGGEDLSGKFRPARMA